LTAAILGFFQEGESKIQERNLEAGESLSRDKFDEIQEKVSESLLVLLWT